MTPAKQITDQLDKDPAGQAGGLEATHGDLRIAVKLDDQDRLGCLFDRLSLEHSLGGALMLDPFRVVDRITYLGERLRVIETDEKEGRSILRSVPPRRDGDVISFFEMVLDEMEGLSLLRYAYDRRRRDRIPVSTPLTRDTLERLLGDLVELAGGS
jgi:hypothetical protein